MRCYALHFIYIRVLEEIQIFAKVTAHDSEVIWPGGRATESARMAVPQRSEGRKPDCLRKSEQGLTDKARALMAEPRNRMLLTCAML
jgi:hypothetical protein